MCWVECFPKSVVFWVLSDEIRYFQMCKLTRVCRLRIAQIKHYTIICWFVPVAVSGARFLRLIESRRRGVQCLPFCKPHHSNREQGTVLNFEKTGVAYSFHPTFLKVVECKVYKKQATEECFSVINPKERKLFFAWRNIRRYSIVIRSVIILTSE